MGSSDQILSQAPVDVSLLLNVELLRDQRDWLLTRFEEDRRLPGRAAEEAADYGEGIVNLLDHILDVAEGHTPNVSVTNITAAVDARLVALMRDAGQHWFSYRDALRTAADGFEANAREYEKAENPRLADDQLAKADECRRRLEQLDAPPPTGDDIPF